MGKSLKIGLTALALAVPAYAYATPYIAVKGLKSAIDARDAVGISDYVDDPALKESLKASLTAKLVGDAGKNPKTPADKMFGFGAAGAMMAGMVVGPLIDTWVSPEALAQLLRGEKPGSEADVPAAGSPLDQAETSMGYEGFGRFVVEIKSKGSAEEPVGLVFAREGLQSWKLSAMRLPL